MEVLIGRQRADVEDSQCQLCKAKEESLEKSKEVEALTSELERVKEEKAQALNDEKLAASSVQALLEEKNLYSSVNWRILGMKKKIVKRQWKA